MNELLPNAATVTGSFATGHAVVIGVGNYRNVCPPLPEAVLNDARDVAAVLTSSAHCGYEPHNVHLLLDGDATLARIRTALASVAETGGPDDTVFIFFSGHGARLGDPADPESALLPVECERTDNGDHELVRDGILLRATTNLRAAVARPYRRLPLRRRRKLQEPGTGRGVTGFRLQREVAWPSGSRHGSRSDRVLPGQRKIPSVLLERPEQRVHLPISSMPCAAGHARAETV